VLAVHHLRKSYGSVLAVDDVSFSVGRGELVAVLGPNGAGKTTTVSIISGLVTPDSGDVHIGGKPLRGDTDPGKRRIGLVPQDVALYDELSARANLQFFGALFGLSGRAAETAIDSVLALVGLAERSRDKVGAFSGGMKRRLNLAAGLMHDPDILLLDEPTVGVDPQSRNAIFENLEELKRRGKTLVYTTHYMEEAERLADRVIIIDRGRVVADDSVTRLRSSLSATDRVSLEEVFLSLTGRSLRD
jgi:ABC-2 type transport system ATP-binding protein